MLKWNEDYWNVFVCMFVCLCVCVCVCVCVWLIYLLNLFVLTCIIMISVYVNVIQDFHHALPTLVGMVWDVRGMQLESARFVSQYFFIYIILCILLYLFFFKIWSLCPYILLIIKHVNNGYSSTVLHYKEMGDCASLPIRFNSIFYLTNRS